MEEVQHLPYLRALMKEVLHLPYDIVLEILSRLPIESLIRFKSVCKRWYNLINDPTLVELQLIRSKRRPHRLILWDNDASSISKLMLLDVDKQGRTNMWKAREISLEYKRREEIFDVHIIGSCNGLICKISAFPHRCCGICHSICIYNPIIKECVVLPIGGRTYIGSSGIFGFGVDSTGKYKVIQIFQLQSMFKGEIITLGESSWRDLKIPYELHDRNFMVIKEMLFMDGSLYCTMENQLSCQFPSILVFDIHDEKFRTIDLHPSIVEPDPHYSHFYLLEIMGSLILYAGGLSFSGRLWKIEINKSKGSLMMYKFLDLDTDGWADAYGWINLVGMLSNNMLLFILWKRSNLDIDDPHWRKVKKTISNHLVVYCMEKKKLLCSVGVSGNIPKWFEMQSFVPSLLSPILVACGKAKAKKGSYKLGVDLEVVGCSSLSEFMDSYWWQPFIRVKRIDCDHADFWGYNLFCLRVD